MIKRKTFLFTVFFIYLTGVGAFAVGPKMMSVQVKKAEVRFTPSFLGKIIAQLSYGDRVQVLEKKDSWTRIGLPGSPDSGWIHSSALTRKKIVLTAGAQDVQTAASSDELALAGKGFNQQVESEFKAKNPNLDFTWIDRMEKFVVSEKQIKQFLKEGGLSPEGGS
jgi:hypothetical protein